MKSLRAVVFSHMPEEFTAALARKTQTALRSLGQPDNAC